MIRPIRNRLSAYHSNIGTGGLIINLIVLGFMISVIVRIGDPFIQIVMSVIMAVAAISAWLIVPISRWNFSFAQRINKLSWWTIVILMVIRYTQAIPLPPLVWLGGLFVAVWGLFANFWLISEPGVFTDIAYKKSLRDIQRRDAQAGRADNPT